MNQSTASKKEDFILGIKSVADTSNSFKHQNKDYLLFFSLGDEEESLIVTITDGLNYLWAKELDISDFEQIRKTLGLEGSFENFFQLFKDAILQLNGSFRINIQATNLDLDLIVSYKISKTAMLTGEINIGTPMHFEQDKTMFRQFIRKTVFDLQAAKKKETFKLEKEVFNLKEKLKATEERLSQVSKNLPADVEQKAEDNDDHSDSKKKKAQTSLINPNLKKGKRTGAKIG
jgi:hypothetical protein